MHQARRSTSTVTSETTADRASAQPGRRSLLVTFGGRHEPAPDQAADLSLCSGGHPRIATSPAAVLRPSPEEAPQGRDVIQELGVRSFINAAGTFTALTGSLMRPEVVAAMQVAARKYVRLEDLHDAVGKRIAELSGLSCRPGDLRLCLGALAGHRGLRRRQGPRADPPAAGYPGPQERSPRAKDPPSRLRPRHPQRGRETDRGRDARGAGESDRPDGPR